MTTHTATLQAVRHKTIEEVRAQKFVILPSKYATGDRNFLEDCKRDGLLSEADAQTVQDYSDGLLTEAEIDNLDEIQHWQREEVSA